MSAHEGDRSVDWEASRLQNMAMASRSNRSRIAPGLGRKDVVIQSGANFSSKNEDLLAQVANMLGEDEDSEPQQQQQEPGPVGRFLRSLTPTGRAGRERAPDSSPLRPGRGSGASQPPQAEEPKWGGRNFTPTRVRGEESAGTRSSGRGGDDNGSWAGRNFTPTRSRPNGDKGSSRPNGDNGGWAGRNFTPTRSRQSAVSPTKSKEGELRGGARERQRTPTKARGTHRAQSSCRQREVSMAQQRSQRTSTRAASVTVRRTRRSSPEPFGRNRVAKERVSPRSVTATGNDAEDLVKLANAYVNRKDKSSLKTFEKVLDRKTARAASPLPLRAASPSLLRAASPSLRRSAAGTQAHRGMGSPGVGRLQAL